MKHNLFFISAIVFLVGAACTKIKEPKEVLVNEMAVIKSEFAPDKRVALFNVSALQSNDTIVLRGESNLPEAVNALKEKLKATSISFVDSIAVLPASTLEGKTYGLINNSVSNLRSNPKHSAELATQATLGTPLKVYKKEGDWFLVQTPDGYLAWVDAGGLVIQTSEALNAWKANSKIIYTKTYGHSYAKPNSKTEIVTDLVAGAVLELLKEEGKQYGVAYPDGRTGYVNKAEAQPYFEWLANSNASTAALVETSKTLMGVPYLWGGTSTKGIDCSGFTKTVYFLNGMIIPRDASQQVHTGELVDEDKNFQNLETGDLLFFGKKATETTKEKVVHVGMWIGNNEFIHASEQVRVSSIDPEAASFDAYNLNRYLRTKRIFQKEDKALIDLKKTPIFTK